MKNYVRVGVVASLFLYVFDGVLRNDIVSFLCRDMRYLGVFKMVYDMVVLIIVFGGVGIVSAHAYYRDREGDT